MITNGITTYRDKHSLYAPALVLALTAELHQMHFVHRGGRRNTRIQSGILWNRKEGFTIFLTSLSDVVIGKSQGEYARVAGFKVCRSPKFTSRHHGLVSSYVLGGLLIPSSYARCCMLSPIAILIPSCRIYDLPKTDLCYRLGLLDHISLHQSESMELVHRCVHVKNSSEFIFQPNPSLLNSLRAFSIRNPYLRTKGSNDDRPWDNT